MDFLAPTIPTTHDSPQWLTGLERASTLTGAINVASKLSLFLAELKRRKVYHVAVVHGSGTRRTHRLAVSI